MDSGHEVAYGLGTHSLILHCGYKRGFFWPTTFAIAVAAPAPAFVLWLDRGEMDLRTRGRDAPGPIAIPE